MSCWNVSFVSGARPTSALFLPKEGAEMIKTSIRRQIESEQRKVTPELADGLKSGHESRKVKQWSQGQSY
jgi:hypothetical protein